MSASRRQQASSSQSCPSSIPYGGQYLVRLETAACELSADEDVALAALRAVETRIAGTHGWIILREGGLYVPRKFVERVSDFLSGWFAAQESQESA